MPTFVPSAEPLNLILFYKDQNGMEASLSVISKTKQRVQIGVG
jgi:hypothetical protein